MRQRFDRAGRGGSRDALCRRVLLTGATSGIGLALARLYAAEGVELALVGRRTRVELDNSLFTPEAYCWTDLADPSAADQVGSYLAKRSWERLDVAILNAGVGWVGRIEQQSCSSIRELFEVNLAASVALAHKLAPLLRGGKLIVVGSIASALPSPSYAVYAACKAALDGLARSLGVELRNQIDVRVIHPGATRTDMHEKAGADLPVHRYPPADVVAAKIKVSIENRRGSRVVGKRNTMVWSVGRRLANVIDPTMRVAIMIGSRRAKRPILVPARTVPHTRAVVTGAGNGIGLAITRQLVSEGARVVAIDKDAVALARLRVEVGGCISCVEADLANPDACEVVVDEMCRHGSASLLVHSAGTSSVGPFVGIDIEAHRETLNVNLLAPILITSGALRHQLLRSGGVIVFVSSLSHFVSYPGASVYAASKDGLTSLSRSLYIATASRGVHCLTVFPGPTRTDHARRFSPQGASEEKRMTPQRVAGHILNAAAKRRRCVVPGIANQAYAVVGRQWPSLTERIMRRLVFDPLAVENQLSE